MKHKLLPKKQYYFVWDIKEFSAICDIFSFISEDFRRLPKISEDVQRKPKIFEEKSEKFQRADKN